MQEDRGGGAASQTSQGTGQGKRGKGNLSSWALPSESETVSTGANTAPPVTLHAYLYDET